MSAILPVTELSNDALWEKAKNAAQLWRANVIDALAQSEAVVSETLLVLSGVPQRGQSVKLHQLLGQRLDELEKALKPAGAFAAEGKAALPKLIDFRRHEALRAALCHGVATVALDRQRKWVVIIKLLSLAGSGPQRVTVAIDQEEAARLLDDIQGCWQRLSAALGNVRAAVKTSPQPVVPPKAG